MTASATPETDKWEDTHARASKAERDVILSALGYITAGSSLPTQLMVETAKSLRAMATFQFDAAVRELLRIARHKTLGGMLGMRPDEGHDGAEGGARQ